MSRNARQTKNQREVHIAMATQEQGLAQTDRRFVTTIGAEPSTGTVRGKLPALMCEHMGAGPGDMIEFKFDKRQLVGFKVHPAGSRGQETAKARAAETRVKVVSKRDPDKELPAPRKAASAPAKANGKAQAAPATKAKKRPVVEEEAPVRRKAASAGTKQSKKSSSSGLDKALGNILGSTKTKSRQHAEPPAKRTKAPLLKPGQKKARKTAVAYDDDEDEDW